MNNNTVAFNFTRPEDSFAPPLPPKRRVTMVSIIKSHLTPYWQSVKVLETIQYKGSNVGGTGSRRLREMTGKDKTHPNYDPEVDKDTINGVEHYRLK